MRLYQPNFLDLPQKLFYSITCIDRDPYFSYLVKIPFESQTTNMATYVVPRHPVTILVTDFGWDRERGNNFNKNQIISPQMMQLHRNSLVKCGHKTKQVLFIFNTRALSVNRKDLPAFTLVKPTRREPRVVSTIVFSSHFSHSHTVEPIQKCLSFLFVTL